MAECRTAMNRRLNCRCVKGALVCKNGKIVYFAMFESFEHLQYVEFLHMYGTAKKNRPCYLVGNLVATNWPIEKALHAIGYNQIPTK